MYQLLARRFFLIMFLAVFVTACSTTPTGRKQLTMVSDTELARQATLEMARLRAEAPLVQDRGTIEFVRCVTEAIVGQLEGDPAEMYWELAVVDRPQVNAYVMPGGKIVVMSGLLSVTDNQHQLAAVLGHEVAHITAHHPNERVTRQGLVRYGVDVVGLILGGGSYNQTRAALESANMAGNLGLMNPFTRMQETEADDIGLDYMARAGFDPRESVKLWQNMIASEGTAKIPEFLSTHPSGESRIQDMVKRLPRALEIYNEAQAAGKNPTCTR